MVRVYGRDGVYEVENGRIKWYSDMPRRVRGFEKVSDAPEDTKMPTRKTTGSACYDFYLPCDVSIAPYSFSPIIPTGIKAYMPQDEVLLLHVRSSVGIKKHVVLANCTGIIDSDYYDNPENEGNIGITLLNTSSKWAEFKKGERIMQAMFVKYGITDNDVTTGERKGGTGSTGR